MGTDGPPPALAVRGILIIEATKQVYAPTRGGLKAVVTRPLKVLEGVRGGPPPEPALNNITTGRNSAARTSTGRTATGRIQAAPTAVKLPGRD